MILKFNLLTSLKGNLYKSSIISNTKTVEMKKVCLDHIKRDK